MVQIFMPSTVAMNIIYDVDVEAPRGSAP